MTNKDRIIAAARKLGIADETAIKHLAIYGRYIELRKIKKYEDVIYQLGEEFFLSPQSIPRIIRTRQEVKKKLKAA